MEELTPEYIVSQIGILSNEEIIELIIEYGNNKADDASYWASKEIR